MIREQRELPAYLRFAASLLVLGTGLLFLPRHLPLGARLLISWNAGEIVFLAVVAFSIAGVGATRIREHSQRMGTGRGRVLLGVLLMCLGSMAAVAVVIYNVKRQESGFRLQVLLCVITVLMAWLVMQTVFALFYARSYYKPLPGSDKVARGLAFSGNEEPDYWDFLYFSCVIGTSYATSDTNIESRRLRRAVLLQSIVSFLFYTLLIGLVMNAIGTLL